VLHPQSRAFTSGADGVPGSGDELSTDLRSSIVATVAIGDLEPDGVPDVVAATLDGEVYAWDAAGVRKAGFPVDVSPGLSGLVTDPDQTWEHGVFATPALADLDGDGSLEIIVATLDQRLLALRFDGTMLDGFPVFGPPDPSDPEKPFLRLPNDPLVDPDGQGRRIVSSPAVGNVDGDPDGNLEILVGTDEAINAQVSLVYAITYDKARRRPIAYHPDCGVPGARKVCFPLKLIGGYPNALPYVGEGTVASPVLGDIDKDGKLEIGVAAIADFGRLFRWDGFDSFAPQRTAFLELKSVRGYYGTAAASGEASSLAMLDSGAFAVVDGDGTLD
jgi:hypothetical protein